MGKQYQDSGYLFREYWTNGRTLTDMANECGVTTTTISDWMDKHGIPRRDQEQAQQPTGVHTDPEWLREKYHDEGMSMKQMAEVADCSPATIKTWMDKHDVQSRSFDHDRRTGPVVHEVLPAGYERVASKNGNGSFDSAYVHQLVAIAYGADPRAVFSGGDYHVHHRNHIPWDNRPENLELLTEQEHMNEHRG